jgi:hypothetical protein
MCMVILVVLFLCVTCSGSALHMALADGSDSSQSASGSPGGPIPATTVKGASSASPGRPGAPLDGAVITGQVFAGPPGSDAQPLPGVFLELFCSAVATSPGVSDGVVKTNSSGFYSFDVSDQCNFYTIVLYTEGEIIHAESPSGVVMGGDQIRIPSPPMGAVTGGNNFWVAAVSPGPTGTLPASPGFGLFLGAVVILLVGALAVLAAVLWRRRDSRDECE